MRLFLALVGYGMFLASSAVWIVLWIANPDMTDMRLLYTNWPLAVVTLVGAALWVWRA